MLRILIHNDGTGTHSKANYDWTVDVNGRVIARGRIKGHNREDGWKELITELLGSGGFCPNCKGSDNHHTVECYLGLGSIPSGK